MVWVLVWVQLISGMPLEYYQLGVYETEVTCAKAQKKAKIMITHNGIGVACLGVTK